MRERPLQAELDRPVVDRRQFVGAGHQQAADPVAHRPPADRGHAVAGEHLSPSCHSRPSRRVSFQRLPSSSTVKPLQHLRLDLVRAVHAEQRVEHHHAVVARGVDGGGDRIEDRQVGLGDELQRRVGGAGDRGRRENCGGSSHECAAPDHRTVLPGSSDCAGNLDGLGGAVKSGPALAERRAPVIASSHRPSADPPRRTCPTVMAGQPAIYRYARQEA